MTFPEVPLKRWFSILAGLVIVAGCQSAPPKTADIFKADSILAIQTPFRAISSTAVCLQSSCDDKRITAAEILAVTGDGMTLVYTDSPRNSIGFLDITNPAAPLGLGTMALSGEPTSIAMKGNRALVAVTTTQELNKPTGELVVIAVDTQSIETRLALPGQPDSIAVSPDKQFAVIAIENERSYKINNGVLPQLPAGEVVTLNIANDDPASWQTSRIDITGLARSFPDDPEPEYVDINSNNQAVVTLQENNHVVVVDVAGNQVINHFSAGSTRSRTPSALLRSVFNLQDRVPREPDGVSWLAEEYIVTADEGDYQGGTDTISIFSRNGDLVWSSGDNVSRVISAIGQIEQTLSNGSQPENIEVATFNNGVTYMFANIERGNVVLVYDASDPTEPELIQVLDTPKGPEGGLAIPARGLFLVASEDDIPSKNIRSKIHIFQLVGTKQ